MLDGWSSDGYGIFLPLSATAASALATMITEILLKPVMASPHLVHIQIC